MSEHCLYPPNPAPEALFDAFAAWRNDHTLRPKERLGERSAKAMRPIWIAWCHWCATRRDIGPGSGPAYLRACTVDVEDFIQMGIQPRRQRPGTSATASPATQRRYARLLQQVYEHARREGYRSDNPVLALTFSPTDRRAADRAENSLAIPCGPLWDALCAAAGTPTRVDELSRWENLRDEALVRVLLDAYLTSQELGALAVDDLVDLEGASPRLQVNSEDRPKQKRELALSGKTAAVLRSWLHLRSTVLNSRTNKPTWVFFSNRGKPMDTSRVFMAVREWFERAAAQAPSYMRDDLRKLAHRGPQVIRNSRIVQRILAGEAERVVCADAGLKDPRSLRHLRVHLPGSRPARSND